MTITEKKIKTWPWTIVSLITSMVSLLTFALYGGWHWHRGPWENTLPGLLGIQWSTAVVGAKDLSVILAVVSLLVAIYVFLRKKYLQAFLCLPTCLLALLTIPFMA